MLGRERERERESGDESYFEVMYTVFIVYSTEKLQCVCVAMSSYCSNTIANR